MQLGPKQKKWIEALRSGNYEQAAGALYTKDGCYCCLGVAAKVCDLQINILEYMNLSFQDVYKELGLRGPNGSSTGKHQCLTNLNDGGKTFNEIADILEQNPTTYFTEAL